MSKHKIFKCHYCGNKILDEKELVIKPVPLATKSGVRNYKRKFHYDCMKNYLDTLESKEVLSEENSWWEKCYEKGKEWLGISPGQNLDQHFVMRLKGLRVGKFLPNGDNTHIVKRGYDFETIYRTMQLSETSIKKVLAGRNFSDQEHKINYLMIIITKNINFVYSKIQSQRKAQDKLDNELSTINTEIERYSDYVKKSKDSNNKVSSLIEDTLNEDSLDIENLFEGV